jgi:hypothetical protein
VTVHVVKTSQLPRGGEMVLPVLNKHFPYTYASEIRRINRTYLWPHKKVATADRQNNTIQLLCSDFLALYAL